MPRTESHVPHVLVVDDDPAIRLVCTTILELDGCLVTEAKDGQEALELARERPPDLVLLDLSLPVLDGLAVATTLRADARTRGVPIVVLTGERDGQVAAKAYQAGVLRLFTKPFDPIALSRFLLGVLEQRRARPPLRIVR